MITENLSTLKIHKLTQEQYDRELEAGRIDENALYLTPDEGADLSEYATIEQLNTKADVVHYHSYNELSDLPTSMPANGGDADTVDGKHAADFAKATEVAELKTLVGNTSVSEQISAAIENLNDVQVDSTLSNEGQAADAKATGDAIAGLSSQLEELSFDILPISRGGTGNTVGYIHTGAKTGTTVGAGATAEGSDTEASGSVSHAEGRLSRATGIQSHAEGHNTLASGLISHAEGKSTIASGENSHAEGYACEASGAWSHAEGYNSKATAVRTHAEGYNTTASFEGAHAEGQYTVSSGASSHAEGVSTVSSGGGSHSEGNKTKATGYANHAEGSYSIAEGGAAHAEGGHYKRFSEDGTLLEMGGSGTKASGHSSHAEGSSTVSQGKYSHAEGYGTLARGEASHAAGSGELQQCGTGTGASGSNIFNFASTPSKTISAGDHLVFIQPNGMSRERNVVSKISNTQYEIDDDLDNNITYTVYKLAYTIAMGKVSRSVGFATIATGDYSSAEGRNTTASNHASHAEGDATKATSYYSHAEGYGTIASGTAAHAEGDSTTASGKYSHAEGQTSKATGQWSHAEGHETQANGESSHAEGGLGDVKGKYWGEIMWNTALFGYGLVLDAEEGSRTYASPGDYLVYKDDVYVGTIKLLSIVSSNPWTSATYTYTGFTPQTKVYYDIYEDLSNMVSGPIASGKASHVEGMSTIASADGSHVEGKYNIEDTSKQYIHITGIGSAQNRANGFTINMQGKGSFASTVATNGADYAEHFEWLDGNPDNDDRIGYMVTLDGDKIRFANEEDDVIGIISGTAAILGDNAEWEWKQKYLTDDFGRIIYEHLPVYEYTKNEETHAIVATKVGETEEAYPKLNPAYDPEQPYVARADRPEWAVVGMFGKLHVRDDGTCCENLYLKVGESGIGTLSTTKTNMRVLRRVSNNVVLVLMK